MSKSIGKRKLHSFVDYVKDLHARNLLRNSFPSDLGTKFNDELSSLPPYAYAGFDPTAESLHVGNLLILTNLLRVQQFGIQPIALIGGATARIGDPSGRTTERNTISEDIVENNAKSVTNQVLSIFENATDQKPIIVNNYEWFGNMGMIDYLRNCKKMQLGEMLRMGAVKSRMESGISFTEFSYQTMQAYDWYMLDNKYGCRFQLGGSDQLGHLDFGAHNIKRLTNHFAAGVCLPLLVDSAGNKLGKSVGGGSLWLDSKKTSPYHFYQYFTQLHDDKAEELLLQLSLRSIDEVTGIVKEHRNSLGKRVAQIEIAEEVTKLVHGKIGLDSAKRCTNALFGGKNADFSNLQKDEILQLFGTTVDLRNVETIGQLADLTRTDKVKGSELMKKGAFSVNGMKKLDPAEKLDNSHHLPNNPGLTLVCWGKRKYQLSAPYLYMSGAAHSKLQKLVLSTYRDFLRASRNQHPSIRTHIRQEFRASATRFDKSEVLIIEHFLRRSQRQLETIRKGQIEKISVVENHKN
ncbi:unnamed protein product [Caenorhabditis angaria]|uniref:Tyrosine--tRNA ligase n=1 Tax=Caenorhabditis angaria TaxID=860376 RepID=A0A9P1N5B5_9PELO|nr:unnamed protein product [Caenorhabditis angaria]